MELIALLHPTEQSVGCSPARGIHRASLGPVGYSRKKKEEKMNNRGFTLIELLVVVAILGILAALAIPQFAQYRGTAYCAQITSEASDAFQAMEAYYTEHLAYGSLSDTNFTPNPNIQVVIVSTNPLVVQAADDKSRCLLGFYTLDRHRARGPWAR